MLHLRLAMLVLSLIWVAGHQVVLAAGDQRLGSVWL
jgi:hypothetical protein